MQSELRSVALLALWTGQVIQCLWASCFLPCHFYKTGRIKQTISAHFSSLPLSTALSVSAEPCPLHLMSGFLCLLDSSLLLLIFKCHLLWGASLVQASAADTLSALKHTSSHAYAMMLCPTLCDPRGCSPIDSSVPVISQARKLEWVAISYSRISSQLRDQTCVCCISCIDRQILYHWISWEALCQYPFNSFFHIGFLGVLPLSIANTWVSSLAGSPSGPSSAWSHHLPLPSVATTASSQHLSF